MIILLGVFRFRFPSPPPAVVDAYIRKTRSTIVDLLDAGAIRFRVGRVRSSSGKKVLSEQCWYSLACFNYCSLNAREREFITRSADSSRSITLSEVRSTDGRPSSYDEFNGEIVKRSIGRTVVVCRAEPIINRVNAAFLNKTSARRNSCTNTTAAI